MSKISEQIYSFLQECFGGGVTTGSFAPAVTNTVYPRPGKKKKSKFRKKTEELLQELNQQQIDDLYSDDEEDPTEQYWKRPTSVDYQVLQQKQAELDKQAEEEKRFRLDKYKSRNEQYLKKINDTFTLWSQQPDVNIPELQAWYNNALAQVNAAENDRQIYEKISANELKNIKPIKMKPITVKFDYWKVKQYNPYED